MTKHLRLVGAPTVAPQKKGLGARLVAELRKLVRRWHERHRKRMTLKLLRELDAHQLWDIGLTRPDVDKALGPSSSDHPDKGDPSWR